MFRTFCKSKITGARVTQSLRQYEGSCGIDEAILEAADIRPYEWILIANVTTGARLETYAKGSYVSILTYGSRVPVSREGHSRLKTLLG